MLINGGKIVWARTPSTPAMPSLLGTRITEEDVGSGAEKWFEVGFPVRSTDDMAGNSEAGWTTLNGCFGLAMWWSDNLADWAIGKFTSIGITTETIDGVACSVYWSRSIYPVDSSIKYGQIAARNSGNARNNPLTSLVINGVIQNLLHYPYIMPGGAAQMQADIRAAGWAGATVTAATALDWEITIPSVDLSGYGVNASVSWPIWYSYDPMGNPVSVSIQSFAGEFINSVGVRTAVPKQFARLGITPLKL